MAIAFGTVDVSHVLSGGNAHPWTFSYNNATVGANQCLFLSMTTFFNVTSSLTPTITYAGSSLTKIAGVGSTPSQDDEVWLYRLVAPSAGINTFSMDWGVNAAGTNSFVYPTIIVATGVDQVTPVDVAGLQTSIIASAVTGSLTVASAVGNVVLGAADVSDKHPTLAGAASHTELGWSNSGADQENNQMSKADGAASTVLTWNWSGAAAVNLIGVEINAAVAVAGGLTDSLIWYPA